MRKLEILAWPAILAASTVIGSLAIACMMPFVALAVVVAASLPPRRALTTVTAIVAAAAYTIDRQGIAAGGSTLLVLFAVIGTCALTLPLALRLTRGLMTPAVYRLIEGFTRRLPRRVGALVLRHLIPRPC